MTDEERAEQRADHPGAGPAGQRAEHMREIDKARRSRVVKLVVALGLAILFVAFVISNSHDVPVDYVFTEVESRLIWVFLVCGLVGGLIGYLLGRPTKGERRLIKEARKLEESE